MKINFEDLYELQKSFQMNIYEKELPNDDVNMYQYHMLAIIEELGEVLKADKRWKTHRNDIFVKDEKKDEIVDVFITAINIALYSGIDCEELLNAINDKIKINYKRLDKNI